VEARRKLAGYAYQISRELIGDELADTFLFPKAKRRAVPVLRVRNRVSRLVGRVVPRWRRTKDLDRFRALVDFVNLGRLDHSYGLPTALYDEESSDW